MGVSLNKEENEEILSLQQQLQTLKKLLKSAQTSSSAESSQKEINHLKTLLNQESHAKEEVLQELENVYAQFRQLKESYLLLQKQQKKEIESQTISDEHLNFNQSSSNIEENVQQLKERFEGAEKRIALLLKDNERLAEQSSKASKAQTESEEQLKIAHYHLAKRVKEAAELADKLDSAQQEIILLNNRLHDANDRVQILETELEQARQAYLQKQLKYEDSLNAAENLAAEWETKYFKLYDKLQETVINAKELQKIEEKYYRMQAIIGGINTLFEEPNSAKSAPMVPENGIPIAFPKESKRTYQNLFDLSRPG